jgi:small nuclear ribonucleoprotein (snRNP)-like protein
MIKNKMKFILTLIFIVNAVFSQQKGILMSSKIDNETEFYRQNKRVRIETNDGKKYIGRIQIIDENTISIDDEKITIESIIKIRSMSLFSALLSTVYIITGSIVVFTGVSAGGFAIIVVPFGIVCGGLGFLIPAIGDNHIKHKWNYKIVTDYP